MKFTCLSENIVSALNTVSRTVSTKSALPALSHIHIKADKGFITLSATNLELGVNVRVTGKVESPGEITVPARLITEFISVVPAGKVEFDTRELALKIVSGKTNSVINGGDPEEFPLIPEIKDNKFFKTDVTQFKKALNQVVVAAANDENRPVLSGVYFNLIRGELVIAATDSYRLAEKKIKVESETAETQVIVPAKTVSELSRIMADTGGEVEVYLSENQISFKIGAEIELVSRLIEGQFPNYLQIIPDQTETKAVINREEFMAALKAAGLFARENANNVKLRLVKSGAVTLYASAKQLGETNGEVAAKVEGGEGEISLNVRYLLDALTNIDSNEITLAINGKLNPALIKPVERTNDYLYIVMPLRS